MDAAIDIADREKSDLTHVIRDALKLYTKSKKDTSETAHSSILGEKIEDYLELAHRGNFLPRSIIIDRVLTPSELDEWSEEILLRHARNLRSRRKEVDSALRRRGFIFRW